MNTRNTAILGGVAVVVLALGLVFGTGNREQQSTVAPGQLAFPNLAAKLQDAARLEITHEGATLKVVRDHDAWTLAGRAGYPAQQAKVHELTAALTGLQLAEPRTSDPSQYARLGVEDAQGKDAHSTLVRVLDASGGAIAELLLGHERTGSGGSGDGVYVRRPGEAQAWLASGQLQASSDVADWIARDIASIAPDKIASVTVTHGGDTLSFARKDGKITMTAPADHPPLDQFKLDDIGRALDNLTLTDVKPAPMPGAEAGRSTIVTTDGMTVNVTVNTAGPDVWAQFYASGEGGAKAAADALQAKVKGWAYQLGNWKQKAFVPVMDDLKAYQPPAKSAASPPAPPPLQLAPPKK